MNPQPLFSELEDSNCEQIAERRAMYLNIPKVVVQLVFEITTEVIWQTWLVRCAEFLKFQKIPLGGYLIEPHLPPSLLDCRAYMIVKQVLSELLDTAHVPLSLLRSTWYQHDQTSPQYEILVRRHLNVTFG
ncbi:hypothetical protein TNCV_3521681 [Trichonephila clavipes]|nr:hypothetical protein TNCV_3521681 [Trichonephila clavipes]